MAEKYPIRKARRALARRARMMLLSQRFPIEEVTQLDNERRRYIHLPSRAVLIRQLVQEALGMRNSLRSKAENANPAPWLG
jgi:hypothetical protein